MFNQVESFSVADTLAAQRIMQQATATANTVQYPNTSTTTVGFIGVSIDDVKETASAMPVAINGIAKVLFNDTVSTGSFVTADSSGRGIPWVPGTIGSQYIGTLVGPSMDSTGLIGEVLINPGYGTQDS